MTFETLDELRDEEKWLKVFSTKAFLAELGVGVISLGVYIFSKSIGIQAFGVINAIVLAIVTYIVTSIEIPQQYQLKGAGLTLDIVILRLIMRSRKKTIYVKNYDNGKEDK